MVYVGCPRSYELKPLKEEIDRGVAHWGGFSAILDGRSHILLKPNFVRVETVDKGSVTHPLFILAVVDLLLDCGVKVTVGDSPGFGTSEGCVRALGMEEELKKRKVDVLTFKDVSIIDGPAGPFKRITIAGELANFDGIINLPKLKTHVQFHFTGATKNLYGCVTGKRKAWRHLATKNDPAIFAAMVLRTAQAVNPLLSIADGIAAMHVNGPTGGERYPLETLLISDNYLELDWLFCEMTNLPPTNTPLFQVAGNHAPEKILGEPWKVHEGFIHGKLMPISFNPFRIMKSVIKDRLVRLKNEA